MRGTRYAAHLIRAGIVAATGIASTHLPSQAQGRNLDCGSFYRVQAGDTLRAITVRTYPHDRYQILFSANRDILTSPARIERGQLLFLPCAGSGPQTRLAALSQASITPTVQDQRGSRAAQTSAVRQAQAESQPETLAPAETLQRRAPRGRKPLDPVDPVTEVEQTAVSLTPNVQTVRTTAKDPRTTIVMLSAAGLEPMAGPELPSGGLVGALIERALREVEPTVNVRPAFVNDRKAHLDVLLPLDAFAMSYPWPAPDCAVQAGFHSKPFCAAFLASIPIFQVETRILARKGDAVAQMTDIGALRSTAICRPQEFPPYDLENQDMRRVILAADLTACLKMLTERKVQAVSVPAPMSRSTDLDADLVEVEALRWQVPVHAIFDRTSPRALELHKQLNAGLRQLQASGEWFSTVAAYLSNYNSQRLAAKK